jgi:hypothetical protein
MDYVNNIFQNISQALALKETSFLNEYILYKASNNGTF